MWVKMTMMVIWNLKVTNLIVKVVVPFSIGKYIDEVLCDMALMKANHILLGRPWQYDRKEVHDKVKNRYTIVKDGKTITLVPLTPKQELDDVFPNDILSELPPLWGIEHQIDFVLETLIPNRPAYRSNPEEIKELQMQVYELINKKYTRESIRPCVAPVLVMPKKDGTCRMDQNILMSSGLRNLLDGAFMAMLLKQSLDCSLLLLDCVCSEMERGLCKSCDLFEDISKGLRFWHPVMLELLCMGLRMNSMRSNSYYLWLTTIVRKSACYSLRIHTILYAEFARQSLSLLMDMLNDDSMADEADVFSVLFFMGRSHGNFAAHIVKEVSQEWFIFFISCISCTCHLSSTLTKSECAVDPPLLAQKSKKSHYCQLVRDAWLLVQSRELAMLTSTSLESSGLEYLFGKLDMRLRELRYRYIGFSKEEELYVLELIVVACMLRLSKVEISCSPTTMKKLSAIISHIEILNDKGSIEPSNILMDAKKTVHEIESSKAGISCSLFLNTNLVDFFTLKQFSLCSRVRHINAELNVPGNDFENPLRFVSGLPVAIPLDITLYNVSSENRLWLTIRMSEELTQFVFLDLNILGGCNEVKKFTFMAPFYRTPKACSFSLWISIGMECALEDCHIVKHCGGPKHDLVYLFQEKEVHLCLVRRG
ncbi:hypothetical protein SADUNF_Sadunf16G0108800 [Salix dunnii]|uniref:Integrator complex subunit 4/Protein SIEL C-terminal Ig-like domain-containing protein n=1 Tax=Salix dunnii TaxID=1413687 RepID=A0A835JB03_9ROSI|nr:hypothetical protein SADUNF_Sadunf16G0108800 [Salix dunnii]